MLCFGDEFVGVVPVSQEICCLLVVNTDVVVLKDAREEVVDFSGDVQNVPHPEAKRAIRLVRHTHPTHTVVFPKQGTKWTRKNSLRFSKIKKIKTRGEEIPFHP